MSSSLPEQQAFEPSAPRPTRTVVSLMGVVLSLALGVGLIVAMFWIGAPGDSAEQERDEEAWQKIDELRAADAARLSRFGWVNRQEQHVHIPIERAMKLYIDDPARMPEPAREATAADTTSPRTPEPTAPPTADADTTSTDGDEEPQP